MDSFVESSLNSIIHTAPAPELTIIVPTFNERENAPLLVNLLRNALQNIDWEVIFVDDNSPDGTAEVVRSIGSIDRRVRCIRRIHRRGLSGAFIEGALASQAPFVAVIDGDLQHDESCLLSMLEKLRTDTVDLVVATRYTEGGSSSSFTKWRTRISRFATLMAHRFLKINLSDPMSGFFMIRRSLIEKLAPSLRTQGFKILLDIVTTAKGSLKIAEIPYAFRKRTYGESKLDTRVVLDFAALIVDKLTAGIISCRFLLFSFVGLIGLGLHVVLLNIALKNGLPFDAAQTLSTLCIIASNFMLNNTFTYGDRRLKGKQFLIGLITFELVCSMGLISNLGIAHWIYHGGNVWWLAGLVGALMGLIWNYMVSAVVVWHRR